MRAIVRFLPVLAATISVNALSGPAIAAEKPAVVAHAGIDRGVADVMRNLKRALGCIPFSDARTICVARNSGLEVVFVETRPGTNSVSSVETLVRTGGENVRETRRAMPSAIRLVSLLLPADNRAAALARAAIERTKTTECVQFLRSARYELEIERVVPADVEGIFANLIVRRLKPSPSTPRSGRPRWRVSQECSEWVEPVVPSRGG